MKFTLKNLGRLEEATIDLGKDLILLTGPNNTSKTYVAHAVYGFCKHFAAPLSPPTAEAAERVVLAGAMLGGYLEVDTTGLLREHGPALLSKLGELYGGTIAEVFAADASFAERARVHVAADAARIEAAERALADIALDSRAGRDGAIFRVGVEKQPGSHAWRFVAPLDPIAPRSSTDEPLHPDDALRQAGRLYIGAALEYALLRELANPHILVAERSAIQLFSRELSIKRGALVDSMLEAMSKGQRTPAEMLKQSARRYSLPIRDSLRIADDLATLRKSGSTFEPWADRLEREVTEGRVRATEEGDLMFYPDRADGHAEGMEMHLASSSVKALSGLVLYLRHAAKKEQFLIVDEPELNLHPDNQRRVARLLARLARAGIKVMISTHSDYVIREINNLIMLSADQDGSLRKKYGYEEDETLSPAQVGAYLFDATRARAIEVQPHGIEVETIDREIHKLNASSQDIYFSLFDKAGS
jgi:AAA domain, putative AbiEii toxin, Type IV TA system